MQCYSTAGLSHRTIILAAAAIPSGNSLARMAQASPARACMSFTDMVRLKIVVERLSKNINEQHLHEIFGNFGHIKDLDLPINRTCESTSAAGFASPPF